MRCCAQLGATRLLRGRAQGGEDQKKECLILTNKAVMLFKTKDRENERSQTKPILAGGKLWRDGVNLSPAARKQEEPRNQNGAVVAAAPACSPPLIPLLI